MPADLNDYFNKKNSNKPNIQFNPEFNLGGKKMGFVYFLLAIVILLVMAKPFVIVHSGEVGIKSTAGSYDKDPLYSGFHVFIPFIQEVMVLVLLKWRVKQGK